MTHSEPIIVLNQKFPILSQMKNAEDTQICLTLKASPSCKGALCQKSMGFLALDTNQRKLAFVVSIVTTSKAKIDHN